MANSDGSRSKKIRKKSSKCFTGYVPVKEKEFVSFLQMPGSTLFCSIWFYSFLLLLSFYYFQLFRSVFVTLCNSYCSVTWQVSGCRQTNIFNDCIFPEMIQFSFLPTLTLDMYIKTELGQQPMKCLLQTKPLFSLSQYATHL